MESSIHASSMYGSVDDSAQCASLVESNKAGGEVDPTKRPRHVDPRSTSSRRVREWLTLALICGLGVGTIMATSRPESSPATGDAAGLSKTAEGGPKRGSLLAERLPVSARQIKTTYDEDYTAPLDRVVDPSKIQRRPAVEVEGDEAGALDYTMTNFYHSRDGKPGADIPWLKDIKLAEPYRETTLTVIAPRDGYSYYWEIRNTDMKEKEREVMTTACGAEVTMTFTKLDINKVVLMEVEDESGDVVRKLEEAVMVKYVRREIRTLTVDEREELLDSMLKLWTVRVQGGNGKELYGEDYADIWAINRLHFKASSPLVCDHFHDGLGFLTSHSLLTNTFEYSLQKVNPKLTVPYWDFTIEKSTYGGNTDDIVEPQASSPLLTADWFGSHDPEDNMVKDGRWAYTEVPRTNVNNPGGLEADVYSKLRSPWNVNNRAYLSRGLGDVCGARVESAHEWPTCELHYNLNNDYSDFYSWVWTGMFSPHGAVHIWLGGVLDCEPTYKKIGDLVGEDIASSLTYFSFIHRKTIFRSGLWSCEGTAEVTTSPEEVLESEQCGCLGYNLESGDDYVTIRNGMARMTELISDFDEDTQRRVIKALCTGLISDGDHLQASSSLDPTFWVTHPTMERLWMFKRLTGTMTDLTWPDTDISYTSDSGETVVEVLSLADDTCVGHRGSDVFPFGIGADAGNPGFKTRTGFKDDMDTENVIPNRQILQMLDPRVNGLNYIYDNFEWKHCAADGFDFNDVWNSGSSEKATRPTFNEGELRYPMYTSLKEAVSKGTASKTS